jgi:hypothetical protein
MEQVENSTVPVVNKVVESMLTILNPPLTWKFGQVIKVNESTQAVVLSL